MPNKKFHPNQIKMLGEFYSNDELYDYYMMTNDYYDPNQSVRDLREDLGSWLNKGFYDDDDGFWSKEILNDLRDCYMEYKELKENGDWKV